MSLGRLYTFGSTAFASGAFADAPSGFELFVAGYDLKDYVVEGSINIDGAINERSIARFMLVNPVLAPVIGQIIQMREDGVRIFGGTIDRIETKVSTNRNTITYQCECIDWQQFLDRRITTKTYTNETAEDVIRDILDTVIQDEGVGIHVIDSGIEFPLVKAEEVRVGDLIRDVAEGAGFTYWIDPDRRLHFVRVSPDTSPFTLGVGTVVNPMLQETREQYINVQRVKVTGTPVASEAAEEVTIERTDATQIAARQAIEGGSGQYMNFESLTHPTSNDSVEIERLARSYAKMKLTRSGRMRKVLRASTYTRGLAPGQLGTVNLPEHGVSGSWLITNMRTVREQVGRWRYEVEAVLTSPFELALDAYLRLVQAGRAIIQVGSALYTTTETFSIVGTDTFTIPGVGDIDIEITTYGGSGGGGGYDALTATSGGAGGASGKAVTFLTLPAGTVLDITVGAKGAIGTGDSIHTEATFTSSTTWTVPGTGNVTVEMTCNGAGGGGGSSAWIGVGSGVFWTGGNGGAGGRAVSTRVFAAGTVLTITIGAAGGGGAGGASNTRNVGADGGATQVTDGGATVYAQGNGGGGGPYGQTMSGQPQGGSGSGSGDSVTAGAGSGGGSPGSGGSEPGHVTNSGSGGSNGTVIIRYIDSNPGTAGTLSKVEISGVVHAQGDGGSAGGAGTDGGSAGTPGSATGDQTFVGGGFEGGPGGNSAAVDGFAGLDGVVEIRY